MKISSFVIASGLTVSFLWSCKPDARKSDAGSTTATEKAMQSADSSWAAMMRSDDAKITNMKRLVSELLLIEGSDSLALQKISAKIDSLPGNRYVLENLESNRIDRYDALCTAAISTLNQEIARIPKAINYQIVNQLVSEIAAADDSVLFYRKNYDRFADQYNSMTAGGKESDEKAGKKLPVFRVIP